jgi:hypothetical protein
MVWRADLAFNPQLLISLMRITHISNAIADISNCIADINNALLISAMQFFISTMRIADINNAHC